MSLRNALFIPIAALASVLAVSSCHTTRKAGGCPPGVICTMIFKTVSLHIVDKAGNPAVLDEVYVTNLKTREVIRPEQTGAGDGHFIVLDDSYRKKIQNTTANFRFTGRYKGVTKVESDFVIGADCCHINKVSGIEEYVIE